MNANERFLSWWGKQRAIGLVRFTLINGVMAWGCTCALVMIMLIATISLRQSPIFKAILFFGVSLPLAGVVWGVLVFRLNEARYRDLLHAQPEGAPPNGGPAASVDNPNAPGGPPSVS
jgi:hypothetical protein